MRHPWQNAVVVGVCLANPSVESLRYNKTEDIFSPRWLTRYKSSKALGPSSSFPSKTTPCVITTRAYGIDGVYGSEVALGPSVAVSDVMQGVNAASRVSSREFVSSDRSTISRQWDGNIKHVNIFKKRESMAMNHWITNGGMPRTLSEGEWCSAKLINICKHNLLGKGSIG